MQIDGRKESVWEEDDDDDGERGKKELEKFTIQRWGEIWAN